MERFIPVPRREIVEDLALRLPEGERSAFRRFAVVLTALYHHLFREDLERLKDSYRPFSPDPDWAVRRSWTEEESAARRMEFLDGLAKVLNDANYEPIPLEEIGRAVREKSPHGLTVSVDLDDFDEFQLYARGLAIRREERRTWRKLWLGTETIATPVYQRLALVVKLKPGRREDLEGMERGAIYLKLFKEIPRADLEMLFPNPRVRMRLLDKVQVGVTGGGATAYGAWKLLAGLAAAGGAIGAGTIGILIGFFALLGRQIAKVFNLRARYMVKLSQNLYLHNLANNAGVFTHLIDLAEEEEVKETLLAYFFLHAGGGMERRALDERIESHLRKEYGIPLDFEVDDSLRKLRERGLLTEEGDRLVVLPPSAGAARLDSEWDKVFS